MYNLNLTIPAYSKTRNIYNKSKVIGDAIEQVRQKQSTSTIFFNNLADILLPTILEDGVFVLKYDDLQPGDGIDKFFQKYNYKIQSTLIPKLGLIRKIMKFLFHDQDMILLIHQLYLLNEHQPTNRNLQKSRYSRELLTKFSQEDLTQIKLFFTLFNIYDDLIINLILKKYILTDAAIPDIRTVISNTEPVDVYTELNKIIRRFRSAEDLDKIREHDKKLYENKKKEQEISIQSIEEVTQLKKQVTQLTEEVDQLKDELELQKSEIIDREHDLIQRRELVINNLVAFTDKANNVIQKEFINQMQLKKNIHDHLKLMRTCLDTVYNSAVDILSDMTAISNFENASIQNIYSLLSRMDRLSIEREFDSIVLPKPIVENESNIESATISSIKTVLNIN